MDESLPNMKCLGNHWTRVSGKYYSVPLTLTLSQGGERGRISILGVVPVFGGPVFYGSGDF